MPPAARGGTEVRTIDHREPFQRSASVLSTPVCSRAVNQPTAIHDSGDVHDTPVSVLDSASTGAGAGSSDQLEPSQRSTSAVDVPKPVSLTNEPTTVQAFHAGHDTAESWPFD
jgi:hypothetical protein